MISRRQLRFAQRVVRKGWVSGEKMLESIEQLSSDLAKNGSSLKDILVEKGYLSREKVREIERELSAVLIDKGNSKVQCQVGNYQLLDKLGEGAMGVVFKARRVTDGRVVAVKLLDEELAHDQEFIKRFLREARNAAKLRNNENIVEAYDFGEDSGKYYFAMEYVDGRCLAEILFRQGKIKERLALNISKQVTRALCHAHKFSIIHRDVKPENIMISNDGIVKLCDLGLAKDLSEVFCKSGGVTLGTVYYASPEQATGSKKVDIRSDIYSLGISLYQMVTGALPFCDSNIRQVAQKHIHENLPPIEQKAPEVSKGTINLINKMTNKKPECRHQTPEELLQEIEKIALGQNQEEEHPAQETSQTPPYPVVLTRRSLPKEFSPYWYVAGGVAIFLLIFLLLVR